MKYAHMCIMLAAALLGSGNAFAASEIEELKTQVQQILNRIEQLETALEEQRRGRAEAGRLRRAWAWAGAARRATWATDRSSSLVARPSTSVTA